MQAIPYRTGFCLPQRVQYSGAQSLNKLDTLVSATACSINSSAFIKSTSQSAPGVSARLVWFFGHTLVFSAASPILLLPPCRLNWGSRTRH